MATRVVEESPNIFYLTADFHLRQTRWMCAPYYNWFPLDSQKRGMRYSRKIGMESPRLLFFTFVHFKKMCTASVRVGRQETESQLREISPVTYTIYDRGIQRTRGASLISQTWRHKPTPCFTAEREGRCRAEMWILVYKMNGGLGCKHGPPDS